MIIEVPGGLTVPKGTQYYKDHAELVDKLSAQYRMSVKSHKLAPMYLRYISDVIGYGVFASKPIAKGDFIGIYAGIVRPDGAGTHGHPDDIDYAWYYTVDSPDNKKLVIDGKYEGNELRFINHTKYPNTHRIDVIVDGKFWVCYVASCNIKQDEQLTVHYGDAYWTSRNIDPAVFS